MKPLFNIIKCILFVAIFSFTFIGCSNEPVILDTHDEALESDFTLKMTNSKMKGANNFHFTTHLSGKNEVPARETKATGSAIVIISPDEDWIYYKVITANLYNVTASHFHMAPAGTNGGVVIGLYANENPQPSGPANGILATGVIMPDDLGGDLSSLIQAIRDGLIYVNVHTTQYPGGEIRGQL